MSVFFLKQKTAYRIEYGRGGSEMCIRDRSRPVEPDHPGELRPVDRVEEAVLGPDRHGAGGGQGVEA